MTHKTNPIAYRLGISQQWHARYLPKHVADMKFMLEEDELLRQAIAKKFKRAGIEKVDVERSGNVVKVFVHTARPGMIIGHGGSGIEETRKMLTQTVRMFRKKKKSTQDFVVQLNVEEVRKPEISAQVASENIALNLEKRLPFRRVIKQSLEKIISYKEVKGAKISVAGRLNGGDIARTEWVSDGKIPLITLRSNIDYAENRALISQGILGIKVWIYKGELTDDKQQK